MVVIHSYGVAVFLAFITMLCWGSWANTQKLAQKHWPFQLFYWDYAIGVLLLSLLLAFTAGSIGSEGRSFLADLAQADRKSLLFAFLGGVVFNIANILLVAAIAIAGMSVAFPIGIGLALALGVIVNYISTPVGNPVVLFVGVAFVVFAIILSAMAYRKLPSQTTTKTKGIVISLAAGVLMGFWYYFVAASMTENFVNPAAGKLTPYSASVIMAIGLFVSNFLWNTIFMYKPIEGEKVTYRDYFKKGDTRLHLIGILGGAIWGLGTVVNIIAAEQAGYAISYGLGQGATLVSALWGVFIWKEFKGAKGVNGLLTAMFLFFVVGLALIIVARLY
ncbi:glucose uptake protein [Tangfeifania diversioriginum]|uniref:Glucose uptake protein n=1 Tax=Tangfeifania diversioriginum TaxID=1168035 RepID=A0A1M6EPM2_9BACT|nr:GRP family sugar transporter [Tangfeifania diversioriginum]SHI87299.1 glucose uptake protein [Tangfeifania diversioriginum]